MRRRRYLVYALYREASLIVESERREFGALLIHEITFDCSSKSRYIFGVKPL